MRDARNSGPDAYAARSLSENRISAPSPNTMSVEIAFTTGLIPRRAMA